MSEVFDVIIAGGGPGGVAAGVYAARKKMKTLLVTDGFGGQSIVSHELENWIGSVKIKGYELGAALEAHVRHYSEIEIIAPDKIASVKEIDNGLEIKVEGGQTYQAKTLVITTGGRRRPLGVPGEDKFRGKGVSYCTTCDASFFKNKAVVMVGGGNSALQGAVDLLSYATKIFVVTNDPMLTGDAITAEMVVKSDKVEVIYDSVAVEVLGEMTVTGFKFKNTRTGEERTLEVGGVFVEIGTMPNSEFVKNLVDLNPRGEIVIDHRLGTTSHGRIFAAGDVTDGAYRQNNIAVGDAIKALLSAYNFVIKNK